VTEVSFHFNAPDKVGYTCRLVRKALASGAKVVVSGQPQVLGDLDVALWTFSALEFIPHCRDAGSAPAVLAASPVVLAEAPASAPHHDVLVNLGEPVPAGFERFERLIEVVGLEDQDRQQARLRWKHYADRGYAIVRHDLATREAR
jgi:DNA polymerase III subunit chi